jgi:hypothetical protein
MTNGVTAHRGRVRGNLAGLRQQLGGAGWGGGIFQHRHSQRQEPGNQGLKPSPRNQGHESSQAVSAVFPVIPPIARALVALGPHFDTGTINPAAITVVRSRNLHLIRGGSKAIANIQPVIANIQTRTRQPRAPALRPSSERPRN